MYFPAAQNQHDSHRVTHTCSLSDPMGCERGRQGVSIPKGVVWIRRYLSKIRFSITNFRPSAGVSDFPTIQGVNQPDGLQGVQLPHAHVWLVDWRLVEPVTGLPPSEGTLNMTPSSGGQKNSNRKTHYPQIWKFTLPLFKLDTPAVIAHTPWGLSVHMYEEFPRAWSNLFSKFLWLAEIKKGRRKTEKRGMFSNVDPNTKSTLFRISPWKLECMQSAHSAILNTFARPKDYHTRAKPTPL